MKGNYIRRYSSKSFNRKIILMGEKDVGKTSIFSMIFTNVYPIETILFGNTISISLSQIIFSGGELIELDDCGGAENYIEEYFTTKKYIFENVTTFIFAIKAEEIKQNSSNDSNLDFQFFEKCINQLVENSPKAKIFVLIHKMDKILVNKRKNIFENKKRKIIEKLNNMKINIDINFFDTSIWDGSLYKPWKEIMCNNMIINKDKLLKGLNYLLEACDADEIFIFELNTFLCICSVDNGKNKNIEERTKKISFLIKKLKQALRRNNSDFSCLKMKLKNIMAYFEEFTKYSYIMVLSRKPKINYEFLSLNIYFLRERLEKSFNSKIKN
jgi:Ras-related GTP-binding protein A/B